MKLPGKGVARRGVAHGVGLHVALGGGLGGDGAVGKVGDAGERQGEPVVTTCRHHQDDPGDGLGKLRELQERVPAGELEFA